MSFFLPFSAVCAELQTEIETETGKLRNRVARCSSMSAD